MLFFLYKKEKKMYNTVIFFCSEKKMKIQQFTQVVIFFCAQEGIRKGKLMPPLCSLTRNPAQVLVSSTGPPCRTTAKWQQLLELLGRVNQRQSNSMKTETPSPYYN